MFDLILQKATEANLPRHEMVKTLFIFSDMKFDECGGEGYKSDYHIVKRKFEEAGYDVPGIVFWNLVGDDGYKPPVGRDERNVAVFSGFSGHVMKIFLERGEIVEMPSPHQMMIDSLGSHYDHLKVCD